MDSLHSGIAGASVRIYTAKDSLSTATDKNGHFRFKQVPKENVQLVVRSLGYEPHKEVVEYQKDQSVFEMPLIVLQIKTQRLAEVKVMASHPMRVAQDTVEYHAAAFNQRPHDRLQDLLRQLPGVRIDGSGNVTAFGEPMTMLRVNGKDFFTNDLKEFLNQLPAGIIAKLQVIDHYGDQANFTGIKTGKPQKMLNLVIKDGQSKGVFGPLEASASTQKLLGVAAQGNLWLDQHQLSANTSHRNTRTETGFQRSSNMGANYRWSGDQWNIYSNYAYNTVRRTGSSASYSETVTSRGVLYNHTQNNNENSNLNQQMQFNLQSRGKKDFWNLQVSGQTGDGTATSHLVSKQTGVITRDLENTTQGNTKIKSGNLSLSWSRNMQKKGRNLSANFTGGAQGNKEQSTIRDQLRFYSQSTGEPLSDSLNQRLLDVVREQSNFAFTTNYAEPLNDHSTAKTKRSLDMAYTYTLRHNDQLQSTFGIKDDTFHPIDSLSNQYATLFYTQQLNLSYRAESAKLLYHLGLSFQPAKLKADTGAQHKSLAYNMFQLMPIASLRYMPTSKHTIQFNYVGNINPPLINQLIPLRDVRNLQQTSIGNPDLKPSKNHQLSLNVTQVAPLKGRTYTLSFNGNIQQDQVVSNVLLLTDTLGNLRQETHYVNTDGAYGLGASYDMTLPFATYYQFRWNTQINKNQSIGYVDGTELLHRAVSWSQNLSVALNKERLHATADVNYYSTNSTYTLNRNLNSRIYTWNFSGGFSWTILPQLLLGTDCNYVINGGYRIPVNNPVLINASLELYLTPNKELSILLQGYDLLDQQQSVNLSIGTNSITQSRYNRIGRYVLLTAKYNLSRFGG